MLLALLASATFAAEPGELDVPELPTVREARTALTTHLAELGYRPGGRVGSATEFAGGGWKPNVWVFDDGWIYVTNRSLSAYEPRPGWETGLPCLVGCGRENFEQTKDGRTRRAIQRVYDDTRDEVHALNDAVAREALEDRVAVEIPAELRAIWERAGVPAAARRAALYRWWDDRLDNAEGRRAKAAAEDFLLEVVQRSAEPFTAEELAALNARRRSVRALELPAE